MKPLKFVTRSAKYSPARTFQHDFLFSHVFEGKTLDLGGGEKARYMPHLKVKGTIVSMNISPDIKPSVLGDVQKKFPFENNGFDNVLSLNLLEHVFEYGNVVRESFRVLKRGGKAVFAVPFLYRIHGGPNDYFRYTAAALEELFKGAGFQSVKVVPQGFGMITAAYATLYRAIPRPLRPLCAAFSVAADVLAKKLSGRYRRGCSQDTYPLGYIVIAAK